MSNSRQSTDSKGSRHSRFNLIPSSSRVKEVASEAPSALVTTLTIVKESLNLVPVPGLKAAVGGVLEIIKALEKTKGNAKDIEELRRHVERLNGSIIEPLKNATMTEALKERINALTNDFELIKKDYDKMSKKGSVRQFLAIHDHATNIIGLDRMLNRAIQVFLTLGAIEVETRVTSTDVRTEVILDGVVQLNEEAEATRQVVLRAEEKSKAIRETVGRVEKTSRVIHETVERAEEKYMATYQIVAESRQFNLTQAEQELIDKLPKVDARYDSASRTGAPGCFENTRVKLLEEIFRWTDTPSVGKIYWLYGLAGTGKSTIAQTVSKHLAEKGLLGASFFFSRDTGARRDVLRVLPTIAFQLAEFSPEFRKHLAASLQLRRDAGTADLATQMDRLLINPLRATASSSLSSVPSSSSGTPSPVIIVMDALDECENPLHMSNLLKLISESLFGIAGINLKVFITSRPEHYTLNSREDSMKEISRPFVLHDIQSPIVQADIAIFLTHELNTIARNFRVSSSSGMWPSADQTSELMRRAGSLFIVASTMTKFISDSRVGQPRRQLEVLLSHKRASGSLPYRDLDQVYYHVLQSAVEGFEDPDDFVCMRFREVVGAMITVMNPLPLTTLSNLLGNDTDYISGAVNLLQSVIVVPHQPESNSEPLQVFHLSFPNFLTERCFDKRFAIDPVLHHSRLALCCLRLLNSFLQRNICGMADPLLLNAEIPELEGQLKELVAPHHEYACQHWGSHLQAAYQASKSRDIQQLPNNINDELLKTFAIFCREKLLQWIELMSLLGCLDTAIPMLKAADMWLKSLDHSHPMLPLLKDGQRLLLQYYEPIQAGASQIYHSALTFMPECMLYNMYKSELGAFAMLVSKRENGWNPCMRTLLGHKHWIEATVFSRNSTLIASGSWDKEVCIWDAVTGSLVKRLQEHTDTVTSVAFSHDSSFILSGSEDKTVCIWDAVTGSLVRKLEGHESYVISAAFSHNSTLIVSGSRDKTVRIWNAVNGSLVKKLEGHKDTVTSVAFSHDSTLIVSGSYDKTVCIWDAATGFIVRTLEGHEGYVRSVAFSHESTLIVSGSWDKTVCIWDAVIGSLVRKLEGHESYVISVAFSHNSNLIISGSEDMTVCIWNAVTGSLLRRLEGHTGYVISVAFSHDSTLIVSGSRDKTVCIWDAVTESPVRRSEGHTDRVTSAAFSDDSSLIVSGSYDRTVCIWDAANGSLVKKLEGHTDYVISVAFSHDSTIIVSGACDKTVRIWDAVTGSLVRKLEGHTRPVKSVAFSHDNCYIITYDDSGMCICWESESYTQTLPLSVSSSSRSSQMASKHLSIEGQWIMTRFGVHGTKKICYLPFPASKLHCHGVSDHLMVLGSATGVVYIIDFSRMFQHPLFDIPS